MAVVAAANSLLAHSAWALWLNSDLLDLDHQISGGGLITSPHEIWPALGQSLTHLTTLAQVAHLQAPR